jgi:hypothetical protein
MHTPQVGSAIMDPGLSLHWNLEQRIVLPPHSAEVPYGKTHTGPEPVDRSEHKPFAALEPQNHLEAWDDTGFWMRSMHVLGQSSARPHMHRSHLR